MANRTTTFPARLSRAGRVVRGLLLAGILTSAFAIGTAGGLILAALDELPQIARSDQLAQYRGTLHARDGSTVLGRLESDTSREYVRYRQLPQSLVDAVVAIEDRRFFEHPGIDLRGIARAAVADIKARELREGGSTLTQQFVKNAYVGPERTIARKSREAVLAVLVDWRWSKERILVQYLNTAYFGEGAYGIADAAETYFGRKEVRNLTLAESALLAGMLQSPSTDSPNVDRLRSRERRATVLSAMHQLGSIDARQRAAANSAPIPRPNRRLTSRTALAPHFTDAVVSELVRSHGPNRVLASGWTVRTTLDARLQQAANTAVAAVDGTGLSSALIAIDPSSGEVRAMAVGGAARKLAFNVAWQGQRQPGSAFKPFSLLAAFEQGYTADSVLESAPYETIIDSGDRYRVENASHQYLGMTDLRTATRTSDNTVFARLAEEVGIHNVVDAARRAGVSRQIPAYPAVALGGLPRGVSTADMALSYATILNHGVRVTGPNGRLRLIEQVVDRDGRVITEPGKREVRAFERRIADQVTDVLEGVVESGTARSASFGWPAAGKTGTTDDHADAWFVGYSPRLVAAVWVGHHGGAIPMDTEYHGGPVFGGTFPADIWRDFMAVAHEPHEVEGFELEIPETVDVWIDPITGMIASSWCAERELRSFPVGQEPTAISPGCDTYVQRAVPDVRGMEADAAVERLEAQEFVVQTTTVIGTAAQAGRVVGITPGAGTKVDYDDVIVLEVASGSVTSGPGFEGAQDGPQTPQDAPLPEGVIDPYRAPETTP